MFFLQKQSGVSLRYFNSSRTCRYVSEISGTYLMVQRQCR